MMKDGLWAAYVKERQGLECLWKEHGFIAYKITGNECFLAEMFIEKEHRSSGKCKAMIMELAEIAKANGCDVITANIHLVVDPNANSTLGAAIGCGFKVQASGNNVLLIAKELKESK